MPEKTVQKEPGKKPAPSKKPKPQQEVVVQIAFRAASVPGSPLSGARGSIETQQMIIARYLEQYPEISVYDTYIDNGATGTNFHRPGFQQMLSDIEAGHVNCVIVKDCCVIMGLNQKDLEIKGFWLSPFLT